jgi:hypothetical protein
MIFLLLSLFLPTLAFAQEARYASDTPALKLDVPVFDMPYQLDAMQTVGSGFFSAYANPSMAQSLALTVDLFSAFHYGMKVFYDTSTWGERLKEVFYVGSISIGDFLLFYLPGGDGWMHEEFHRAVMSRFRVHSFNDMNTFPLFEELVSVNSLSDDDLERFKAESPADFIRMHEAGIEGEYLFIDRLQRNNFFYDQNLVNWFASFLVTLNVHLYVIASADPGKVDGMTDTMNVHETDSASRDFTGFDLTGWVYDLFRPYEPYRDRGVHPSGVGINRYRKTTDLTSAELRYLWQQGYWQVANYLSPMLFGVNSIALGNNGLYGNFAFRHLLTSFGTDLSLTILLKRSPVNLVFAYHNYQNYRHVFPAVELELIEYPVRFSAFGVYLSARVLVGMQPENQGFTTDKPAFLGLISMRVDGAVSRHWFPYFELTAKTAGWVAGNEFLNSTISARLGISARF